MLQRNRICVLPKEIADKIAAGEVVDQPLSVVKELLENAIDAGADKIVVEIKSGGKTYIRVTDNGCGIPSDELETAFLRHATSKIEKESDLDAIATLGFRGEALASIAAVSRVFIVSKPASEIMGTQLRIEGGRIIEEGGAGCPVGTTIVVEDLFFNTPARLKFLKTDASESTKILDFLSKMAIAYPKLQLRVINNGSILFSTNGKGSIPFNFLTIYSREIGDRLIRSEGSVQGISADVFHSALDKTRKSRKYQIYFVNGRSVESRILDRAVALAYQERIPSGRFPVVFLFLQVAPDRLDVNIHPNKKEVRFEAPNEIEELVVSTIRRGLLAEGSPIIQEKRKSIESVKTNKVDVNSLLSTIRKEEPLTEEQQPMFFNEESVHYEDQQPQRQRFSTISIKGTVFGTYIIGKDETHLFLIDQHAAHERVFYEKLLRQRDLEIPHSQILLAPFLLETSAVNAAHQEQWLPILSDMGFCLDTFGQKTYLVKEIPEFTELSVAKAFLEDFLDQLNDDSLILDSYYIEKLILHACKSAVKANDNLDPLEIKRLLEDLDQTENPLTCPHGRPTYVKLTKYELEKLFKRV